MKKIIQSNHLEINTIKTEESALKYNEHNGVANRGLPATSPLCVASMRSSPASSPCPSTPSPGLALAHTYTTLMPPGSQAYTPVHSPSTMSAPVSHFQNYSTNTANNTHQHDIKVKLEEVLGTAEASAIGTESKMRDLCQFYTSLIPQDKVCFLKTLATDYATNQDTVLQLANTLAPAQERGTAVLLRVEERLRQALIPRYQTLFTQISHLEFGVKFLVDLRTDVLNVLTSHGEDHDHPHLQALNLCLQELLRLWFSVGFFHLERITWESPCDMLQKISEYEAVHPIRNWPDLKRRVGPYRRCFVFTHNSMPREPVVILHTALTNDITSSVQTLVSRSRVDESPEEAVQEDPDKISTAIFYSITSTKRGLTGVELGNYLIKNAVKELLQEFPRMHQFSSLSPIPGFREWLLGEMARYLHHLNAGEDPEQLLIAGSELEAIRDVLPHSNKPVMELLHQTLHNNNSVQTEALVRALKSPLMKLCARYLYLEKRRAYALNHVANFHLRNGATMWRLNWMADTSPRGLSNSFGMMINYRYYLDATEYNSKHYLESFKIQASEQILDLVQSLPTSQRSNTYS